MVAFTASLIGAVAVLARVTSAVPADYGAMGYVHNPPRFASVMSSSFSITIALPLPPPLL